MSQTTGLPSPNGVNTISGETFAEKVKYDVALQLALYAEPARVMTEVDKLDFLDAIRDELYVLPDNITMPHFLATACRDQYIIVTAADHQSKNWLIDTAPKLMVWKDHIIKAIHANAIPKLVKGLLWLPGRRKISNEDILKGLKKQNPSLNVLNWKIFKRHEESHGTRLAAGIDEESAKVIASMDNKPQWSTSRAVYTPVSDMITRRKAERARREVNKNVVPKTDINIGLVQNKPPPTKNPPLANKEMAKNTQQLKRKPEGEAGSPQSEITPQKEQTYAFRPKLQLLRSPTKSLRPGKKKKTDDKENSGNLMSYLTRGRSNSLPLSHVSPSSPAPNIARSSVESITLDDQPPPTPTT